MSMGSMGNLAMLGEETGMVCTGCGCTDERACVDDHGNTCVWVAEDLCSMCDEQPEADCPPCGGTGVVAKHPEPEPEEIPWFCGDPSCWVCIEREVVPK